MIRHRGQMKVSPYEIPSRGIPSTSETRSMDTDQVGGALSNCRAHSQGASRYLVRQSKQGQMRKGTLEQLIDNSHSAINSAELWGIEPAAPESKAPGHE